jgi:hypothetical protein
MNEKSASPSPPKVTSIFVMMLEIKSVLIPQLCPSSQYMVAVLALPWHPVCADVLGRRAPKIQRPKPVRMSFMTNK